MSLGRGLCSGPGAGTGVTRGAHLVAGLSLLSRGTRQPRLALGENKGRTGPGLRLLQPHPHCLGGPVSAHLVPRGPRAPRPPRLPVSSRRTLERSGKVSLREATAGPAPAPSPRPGPLPLTKQGLQGPFPATQISAGIPRKPPPPVARCSSPPRRGCASAGPGPTEQSAGL